MERVGVGPSNTEGVDERGAIVDIVDILNRPLFGGSEVG